MNMTPRNIAFFALAGALGVFLGFRYQLLGLALVVPVLIFVVVVLLRNKGGAEAGKDATFAARRFVAPPAEAAIYIMRHGFVGGQQGMNVTIDGRFSSQFRSGRFVCAAVAPGEHRVEARMASQTAGTAVSTTLTLAAGECVLLDAKLDVGMLQGKLVFKETRDAGEARTKLASLKLVEWKATA